MSEKPDYSDALAETDLATSATATSMGTPGRPTAAQGGDLSVGDTLGTYEIRGELGRGGMGVVYLAHDPKLDRKVAIKVLRARRADGSVTDADSARFLREARAIARLSHPNVITVHEANTAGRRNYVVMEYIHGRSMAEWLDGSEARDWREVLAKFLSAGRGLGAAHESGLVHRDFKPANVLLSDDGRVLVTDFGLARMTGEKDDEDQPSEIGSEPELVDDTQSLTRTGAILGTPAYMAPEQHGGHIADRASDQYSFCVSLYEGLYGGRPFVEKSLDELTRAKLAGAIVDEPRRSPVPRRIRRLITRGLAPEPEKRHESMHDLLVALSRASRPRWQPVAWVAAAVVIVGVAIAVVSRSGDRLPGAAPECAGDAPGIRSGVEPVRERSAGQRAVGPAARPSRRRARYGRRRRSRPEKYHRRARCPQRSLAPRPPGHLRCLSGSRVLQSHAMSRRLPPPNG